MKLFLRGLIPWLILLALCFYVVAMLGGCSGGNKLHIGYGEGTYDVGGNVARKGNDERWWVALELPFGGPQRVALVKHPKSFMGTITDPPVPLFDPSATPSLDKEEDSNALLWALIASGALGTAGGGIYLKRRANASSDSK